MPSSMSSLSLHSAAGPSPLNHLWPVSTLRLQTLVPPSRVRTFATNRAQKKLQGAQKLSPFVEGQASISGPPRGHMASHLSRQGSRQDRPETPFHTTSPLPPTHNPSPRLRDSQMGMCPGHLPSSSLSGGFSLSLLILSSLSVQHFQ